MRSTYLNVHADFNMLVGTHKLFEIELINFTETQKEVTIVSLMTYNIILHVAWCEVFTYPTSQLVLRYITEVFTYPTSKADFEV